MQWEVGVQRDAKHRLQAENEALQEQLKAAQANPHEALTSPQQREFPSALELLNKLHRRRKKPTIREVDIEIILEILGGESDDASLS